ncbi:MAG: hypothetical protein JO126_00605 [Alphaproteobacteria bacterium]|nr:hypothetical protein [Alphaproteobacteria bacterium]
MLSYEELTSAFDMYARDHEGFLPNGKIVGCDVNADGTVTVNLQQTFGIERRVTSFVFRDMDVLKPLIHFCITTNIMLPRSGRKSYAVISGSPTLAISLNITVNVEDSFVPMNVAHIKELAAVKSVLAGAK